MTGLFSILRRTGATLAGALILYLTITVISKPDNPSFFGLRPARDKIARCWQRLENRPPVYPSRRREIIRWIADSAGTAAQGFESLQFSSQPVSEIQGYTWPATRKKIKTWMIKTRRPEQALSWFTATCSEKRKTTFLFSGGLNPDGEAVLSVNGNPVLTFNTDPEKRPPVWEKNGILFRFFPLLKFTHESGIFCLTVPAELITPGQPLLLGAKGLSGTNDYAFFALHDQRDTRQLIIGP